MNTIERVEDSAPPDLPLLNTIEKVIDSQEPKERLPHHH